MEEYINVYTRAQMAFDRVCDELGIPRVKIRTKCPHGDVCAYLGVSAEEFVKKLKEKEGGS